MPFVYYGGKKGLARYYPPPSERTIIEPFAGSAGYALHWATPNHRVILVERDPAIVALWRRLQMPNAAQELQRVVCPPAGRRSQEPLIELSCGRPLDSGRRASARANDPLIALCAGPGAAVRQSLQGRSFVVTTRMARDWERARSGIISALPKIRHWEIIEGDYTDAPDIRATWFIDPPYWVPPNERGTRGDGYRYGASGIDFDRLADWSRARKGQVIVCEQEGASWLPFRPLRRMSTAAGDGGRRTEVVWSRTPGKVLGTPQGRSRRDEAARRRSARIASSRGR